MTYKKRLASFTNFLFVNANPVNQHLQSYRLYTHKLNNMKNEKKIRNIRKIRMIDPTLPSSIIIHSSKYLGFS